MRHFSAWRRLSQLLDHTLPAATDRAVWAHVDECGECQDRLAEYEACGRLLERLPAGLIPLSPTPAGEQRLVGLARWSPAAAVPRGEGPETAALALAAAALACVVALAGARSSWVPDPDTTASAGIHVAYVLPGAVRAP
jgi:anti-sigma factor RsiW